MQVRFLGFSFSTDSTTLSLDSYINHMANKHGQPYKLGEHNRFLYLNTTYSENYYIGLLVTVKDQKTYCELINYSGKLVVKVNEIDENTNLMDFNFFVLHKASGLGMYQYYHQSCSLNSFGYLNNRRFAEYRDNKIQTNISAIPEQERTEAKEKAIKFRYKGNLNWEILVRLDNLKALIEEFQRVKTFEYNFLSFTVEEPEFKPIGDFLKKKLTKLTFTPGSPVDVIANAIYNLVDAHDVEKGKITGIDQDGVERILRITNNPDNFGEYTYDDVALKINSLDIEQFEKSWVVQELLNKCDEHKHIFEAKIK